MAQESNDMHGNAGSLFNGVDKEQALVGTDDRTKTTRHPRWTRQETLILIQCKKVVEDRIKGGCRSNSALISEQLEPKWDSISSYCKQHGVNREPVQCRKRWSNLLGDFKKIKSWESQMNEEAESFWMMRNDFRKERKLPAFFDREVYDVLDGRPFAMAAIPLSLVTVRTDSNNGEGDEAGAGEEEKVEEGEEAEAVLDSGQHATPENGLFSEFEQSGKDEIGQSPQKETIATDSPTNTYRTPLSNTGKRYQPFCQGYTDQGTEKEKNPGSMSQEGWKRRRLSLESCEESNLGNQLIRILERNSNMLNAQLEAQNINCQLDRSQRKEHTDSLVGALSKLTDALVKIAEKL